MGRRKRQVAFRLAALGIYCALTLVLGEGLIRVYVWARGWTPNCYAADLDLYQPHPTRGSEFRPGFRLRSGVFRIAVNRWGLRGPDISRTKSAGVTRIAVLGGSSVFGYFVSDGEEAARLLERSLDTPDREVQVLNAGVPGYNLFQTCDRFEERIVPLAPDIVVLYLGWNDLPYICSEDPRQLRHRIRPIAPDYERHLGRSTLYGFVKYRLWGVSPPALLPRRVGQAIPTVAGRRCFRENLDKLAAAIRGSGAKMLVSAQCIAAREDVSPELQRQLHGDNQQRAARIGSRLTDLGSLLRETLETFARDHRAPFVDLNRTITADETMLRDYVHLTAVGERQLAACWAVELEALLRSRTTEAGEASVP